MISSEKRSQLNCYYIVLLTSLLCTSTTPDGARPWSLRVVSSTSDPSSLRGYTHVIDNDFTSLTAMYWTK